MSKPPKHASHSILLFDDWVVDEFRRTEGFTVLVVLVGIGHLSVVPLRSTFIHIVGDDLDWTRLSMLLASAGIAWDGVLFETLSAEGGGPVGDEEAREALRALDQRVVEDRLTINRGHFFDKWGRRLKVEEAQPQ